MSVTRRAVLGFVGLLAATLLALTLAGCPGPTFVVQQYRGAPRPRETIAVLRVNGGDSVRLLFLDGEDVAAPIVEDGRLHIEIIPARHTLVVGNASAPNEHYAPVAFQAEAGRVYRVAFAAGAAADARVYEVDREKDRAVRDVTLPPEGVIDAPGASKSTPPATGAAPVTSDAGEAPTEP